MENEKFYPYDLLVEILGDDAIKAYLPALDTVLSTLTEREENCIRMKFFEGMTLEQIGKSYNITRERIRQIITKGCRKLRHPSRKEILLGVPMSEVKQMYLYLKRDIEDLQETYENLLERLIGGQNISIAEVANRKSKDTLISALDLSVRSYNCLSRANIKSVGDICKCSIDDLMKVRNLGRHSLEEVVNKIHELGYKLREEEL